MSRECGQVKRYAQERDMRGGAGTIKPVCQGALTSSHCAPASTSLGERRKVKYGWGGGVRGMSARRALLVIGAAALSHVAAAAVTVPLMVWSDRG